MHESQKANFRPCPLLLPAQLLINPLPRHRRREADAVIAHKNASTTQRYAHLSMKHKNAVASQVAQRLSQIAGRAPE